MLYAPTVTNSNDISTVLAAIGSLTSARDFEAARDLEASLLRTLVTAAAHGEDIQEAAKVWHASEGDDWFAPGHETRADALFAEALEWERAATAEYEEEMRLTLARPEDSTPEERTAAALGFGGW
jgi:hypothetical protein